MRRSLPVIALVLLAGCGGEADKADRAYVPPPITKEAEPLPPRQAQPAAPATAGTLVRIPDSADAQRRLGYVNADALAAAELPVRSEQIVTAVLGADVRPDRVLVGSRAVRPADPPPQRSAITPQAQASVQSCLGDTLAQTVLGPKTMGFDAALGAGLTVGGGEGLRLRICGAPYLVRDLDATEQRLRERFGKDAIVVATEIGERAIVNASVVARRLAPGELIGLLSGGSSLRGLAWRPAA